MTGVRGGGGGVSAHLLMTMKATRPSSTAGTMEAYRGMRLSPRPRPSLLGSELWFRGSEVGGVSVYCGPSDGKMVKS